MTILASDEASTHVASVIWMEASAQQEQRTKVSVISNVNTNNTKPSSIIVVMFIVLLLVDPYISNIS
jgi:hypothetical protein